jgi:transposase-like protein
MIEDGKLSGGIKTDESYIGGKARNMHKTRRPRSSKARAAALQENRSSRILERGGHIRARVIDNSQRQNVLPAIRENVEQGSHVYTDELKSCFGLQAEYVHNVINHAELYVSGKFKPMALISGLC